MSIEAGKDAVTLLAEAIRGRPIPTELRVHASDVLVDFNSSHSKDEVLAVVDEAIWRVQSALAATPVQD